MGARSNSPNMRLLGVLGDLTQLRREFRQLTTESVAEEEKAKYELTASARKFSRRTKNLVDDKMTFSATLMRAGEIDAANRLLEEVEQDVRVEEAALIEKMNEVKIARANKRERLTRVRLARLMAVSLAGSMLMGMSALGMAAAGFVQEREQDQIRKNSVAIRRALRDNKAGTPGATRKELMKNMGKKSVNLLLANVEGDLTPAEVAQIQSLGQQGNVAGLESLLNEVLDSAGLARQLATAITGRVGEVIVAAPKVQENVHSTLAVPKYKKKARKAAEDTAEAEPSPSPDESPPPEETDEKGDKQETEKNDGEEKEADGPGDMPFDDGDLQDI